MQVKNVYFIRYMNLFIIDFSHLPSSQQMNLLFSITYRTIELYAPLGEKCGGDELFL